MTQFTDAEWAALAPFTIDVTGLPETVVEELRQEFREVMVNCRMRFAVAVGRRPTDKEIALLAGAVVAWQNRERLPLHRQRVVGLN